jgi:phosphate transport system permease protein
MRHIKETIATYMFFLSAFASGSMILAIFGFMIALGFPLFQSSAFYNIWSGPWSPEQGLYGIWPMICGTLQIAFLATALCLPVSLGTSFVIACLGGLRIRKLLRSMVLFMTGIPTVIYGFLGIFLLVPLVRERVGGPGLSVLTAAMVLAILISPTMILFFTDSLLAVDVSVVRAAKALGATRIQRLLYVMLPKATGGIASGVILALGRALGDTLIALMLAGNAIHVPHSILDPTRTLTAHIALVKAADFNSLEFRSIFACGIVLYLFATTATIVVRLMLKKREEEP